MSKSKRDAALICEHLDTLRGARWLGPARSWWPDYLFHFTDILNVLTILKSGCLLCRSQATIARDIASAEVIERTQATWKGYVRLYFRPRTPTQYHNEGFRPQSQLGPLQAHCPMPIFLLFDSRTILCAESTRFSDGNLASGSSNVGSDAAFLQAIPFEKVYHDSWFEAAEKQSIIYHRHAEVLVPGQLDLTALRWIVCRSYAELRTLRQLLSSDTWSRFADRVKTAPQIFYKRWPFAERAELSQEQINIHFNRTSTPCERYHARLEIEELQTGTRFEWEDASYVPSHSLEVEIPQFNTETCYAARLTLDGAIAFADTFVAEEFPF